MGVWMGGKWKGVKRGEREGTRGTEGGRGEEKCAGNLID